MNKWMVSPCNQCTDLMSTPKIIFFIFCWYWLCPIWGIYGVPLKAIDLNFTVMFVVKEQVDRLVLVDRFSRLHTILARNRWKDIMEVL